MSGHTQGPWTVSKPSGNYIEAPTGGIAALTYGATKADAHLIAAAPDMLAVLEDMDAIFRDEGIPAGWALVAQELLAVIDKAKGADQ